MGCLFNTVKWFLFALNILCMFFGVGDIYVNAVGVEAAQPGTDAHTFFILAILICSLLCLTTVIGCYGVISEVFGINVIYSIFILSLLIIQCLQIWSFQPNKFYLKNLEELESAWRLVEAHPKYMDAIQTKFYCCGLFNAHDYSYKNLSIPDSCYNTSHVSADGEGFTPSIHQINNVGCLETVWRRYYEFIVRRYAFFSWALFVIEFFTFICSITLSILILKRGLRSSLQNLNQTIAREFSHQNHIGSRQLLLSN